MIPSEYKVTHTHNHHFPFMERMMMTGMMMNPMFMMALTMGGSRRKK